MGVHRSRSPRWRLIAAFVLGILSVSASAVNADDPEAILRVDDIDLPPDTGNDNPDASESAAAFLNGNKEVARKEASYLRQTLPCADW